MRGNLLTIGDRAKFHAPRVALEVLGEAVDQIEREAKARWPVDTGKSRSLLDGRVEVQGSVVRLHIHGGADYTLHIVSRGVKPWDRYVLLPLQQLAREAAAMIGDALWDRLAADRG